jgi:hypothetical protein
MRNMGPDMPPFPSRTPRTGPAAARSLAPARRLAAAPARRPSPAPARLPSATPVAPPVKILLAGIDKDDRRAVEATIRHALGAHASSGAWSISVVSFGNQWSVTLDGPGDRLRGVSFVTEPAQLRDAIRKAIGGGWEGLAPGSPPDSTLPLATDARDTHVCEYCRQTVVVVYELRSGEPKTLAPLACPHCWKVGHVEIGAWAAAGGDYRSEKG